MKKNLKLCNEIGNCIKRKKKCIFPLIYLFIIQSDNFSYRRTPPRFVLPIPPIPICYSENVPKAISSLHAIIQYFSANYFSVLFTTFQFWTKILPSTNLKIFKHQKSKLWSDYGTTEMNSFLVVESGILMECIC